MCTLVRLPRCTLSSVPSFSSRSIVTGVGDTSANCVRRQERCRRSIASRHERGKGQLLKTHASKDGNRESPSNFPLDWDPFEDLFGLGIDMRSSRAVKTPERSWSSSRQSLKELPCDTCRGRGYMLCQCKMRNLGESCSHCAGKGFRTCPQCGGQCLVSGKSLTKSTWESAQLRSPLKIEDDAAIDCMDIPPVPKRQTRRVYGPLSAEVREKISRSLKTLERRTGSISRRLKMIHADPVLHEQLVTAIKKGRSTQESRQKTSEKLKAHFVNPENRLKRSFSMTGIRFFCRECREEGHRKNHCPKLGFVRKRRVNVRAYHCSNCGHLGHQRRSCKVPQVPRNIGDDPTQKSVKYRCGLCREMGHTKKSCPNVEVKVNATSKLK